MTRDTLSPNPSNAWERALFIAALLSMPFVWVGDLKSGENVVLEYRFTLAELLFLPMACAVLLRIRSRSQMEGLLLTPVSWLALSYLAAAVARPSATSVVKAAQFAVGFLGPYLVVLWAGRSAGGRRRIEGLLGAACAAAFVLAAWQQAAGCPAFFVRGGLPNNHVYSIFLLLGFPFLFREVRSWAAGRRLWRWAAPGLAGAALSVTIVDTGLLLALLLELGILNAGAGGRARRFGMGALAVAVVSLHLWFHGAAVREFLTLGEKQDVAAAWQRGLILSKTTYGALVEFPVGTRTAGLHAAVLAPRTEALPAVAPELDPYTLKQRFAEWGAAARMLGEHFVVGVGPGNYQRRIGGYYSPADKMNTSEPDMQNGWLVLGASAGFGAVLSLWIAIGAIGLRVRRSEEGDAAAAYGALSPARAAWAAGAGIVWGGFWAPFFQTGAMVPLAVILALGQTTSSPSRQQPAVHPLSAKVRRCLGGALALLALGSIAPSLAQRSRPIGVYVWREAEDAQTIEPPAASVPFPDASGGAALAIAKGVGAGWRKEAGGSAAYDVDVPEAGDYDLWARAQWTDGCRNSFFVRCNDAKPLTLGNDAVYGEWHWLALRQVPLRRGKNRMEFANREDGVALDKFLITSDARFAPQGASEAVFSRDLADQPLIGWSLPLRSPWKARRGAGFSGLVLDSRPSVPSDVLLSSPTQGEFQLDGRFQLLSPQSDLILYFLYDDARNYSAVEVAPGHLGAFRIHNGERHDLARSDVLLPLNEPADITIAFRNGPTSIALGSKPLLEWIDRRSATGRCGFGSLNGQAGVERFDLRPLDGIYYRWDRSAESASASVAPAEPLRIGSPAWRNFRILLEKQGRSAFPAFRFGLKDDGDSRYEFSGDAGRCAIRSVVHGAEAETRLLGDGRPIAWEDVQSLEIRCLDQEIAAFVDGAPLGGAVFADANPLKGAIEIPTADLARIEVQGMRRFYDGFGGCDGANDGSWEPQSGVWRTLAEPIEGLVDCYGQLAAGEAITLTGKPFWENYDLRCMVRSSTGAGIGVVLHYADPANFDYVRWASSGSPLEYAGKLQVVRRRGGADTVLASVDVECETDRWYELRVVSGANSKIVFLDEKPILESPLPHPWRGRPGLYAQDNPGAFFDNVAVDLF